MFLLRKFQGDLESGFFWHSARSWFDYCKSMKWVIYFVAWKISMWFGSWFSLALCKEFCRFEFHHSCSQNQSIPLSSMGCLPPCWSQCRVQCRYTGAAQQPDPISCRTNMSTLQGDIREGWRDIPFVSSRQKNILIPNGCICQDLWVQLLKLMVAVWQLEV